MEQLILQPKRLLILFACLLLMACDGSPLNDPYPPEDATGKIFYSAFSARPKYLDPARSYSSDESVFTAQIYEPPLQYAYETGTYRLIPLTADQMPTVTYLGPNGEVIDGERYPEKVAETVFDITIKKGILYQPHPAFYYAKKSETDFSEIDSFDELTDLGTRECLADDYVYEIKRLAWPKINSPIYEMMSQRIIGLKAFHESLKDKEVKPQELRDLNLSGVRATGPYSYQIRLKGVYPQFPYWLAMPFFAPIPWEADAFYDNEALIKKNIVLDWFPVGTGPYLLSKNNPNSVMEMVINPYYRDPPEIERMTLQLEKENIPRWNKFLQGYYDTSGIDSDSFNSAIQTVAGQSQVTPALKEKEISLITEVKLDNFYWGFNMRDETVGGYTAAQQKLRQAISIAIDVEEYIEIFMNGRAQPAQFILPPNIFGYEPTPNPYIYDKQGNQIVRKNIEEARKLLAEAGYPGGKNVKTGDPLIIRFDTTSDGSPDTKARDAWMRKQFKKLGIDLDIRATDYNRFREKLDQGNFQFFFFGWIGDYPDPENFLFLLYGPNGKQEADGVNSSNYNNPEYNRLFEKMILLPNNAERESLIHQMMEIAQFDSPLVWGFHRESYLLKHGWLGNVISNQMVRNNLKYFTLDPVLRAKKRIEWNRALFWPVLVIVGLLAIMILPVYFAYRYKEHHSQAKRFKS